MYTDIPEKQWDIIINLSFGKDDVSYTELLSDLEIERDSLFPILNHLSHEKYIEILNISTPHDGRISILPKGEMIKSNGGFYEEKIRRDEIYKTTKKTFAWTKVNTIWVIVAAILTFIAILVAIYK